MMVTQINYQLFFRVKFSLLGTNSSSYNYYFIKNLVDDGTERNDSYQGPCIIREFLDNDLLSDWLESNELIRYL